MSSTNGHKPSFETQALHAGYTPDPTTRSRAVPIYQTTAYQFRDTDHAAALFALQEPGNIYSRIMNPTNDVFEQRLATLEGGIAALATSSGHFAEALSILTLCNSGDEFISTSALYGGSYTMFSHTMRRLGITAHLVQDITPNNIEPLINDRTRFVYLETLGNPKLEVPDFEAIAKLAHSYGLPVIVDNTFGTPYLFQPFQWGVNISIHSTTKWISGHGLIIGGAIVDGGNFDWKAANRHPNLLQPEPAYHGAVMVDVLGAAAFIGRARVVGLRDLGGSQAPFNTFLALIGLETLALRMQRHADNALAVARFLEQHSAVSWVNYPGLPSHPSYENARKYMPKGAGAVIGFGIKGGKANGKTFIDSLGLFSHLANVGDTRSLAIHPATTTHSQLTEEEQFRAGVSADFVRLSVGIENIDDILADLDQALRTAEGVTVHALS